MMRSAEGDAEPRSKHEASRTVSLRAQGAVSVAPQTDGSEDPPGETYTEARRENIQQTKSVIMRGAMARETKEVKRAHGARRKEQIERSQRGYVWMRTGAYAFLRVVTTSATRCGRRHKKANSKKGQQTQEQS